MLPPPPGPIPPPLPNGGVVVLALGLLSMPPMEPLLVAVVVELALGVGSVVTDPVVVGAVVVVPVGALLVLAVEVGIPVLVGVVVPVGATVGSVLDEPVGVVFEPLEFVAVIVSDGVVVRAPELESELESELQPTTAGASAARINAKGTNVAESARIRGPLSVAPLFE